MQRPNSSRLYGLLMITAIFIAVFALVTALGTPTAGAQANARGVTAPARRMLNSPRRADRHGRTARDRAPARNRDAPR